MSQGEILNCDLTEQDTTSLDQYNNYDFYESSVTDFYERDPMGTACGVTPPEPETTTKSTATRRPSRPTPPRRPTTTTDDKTGDNAGKFTVQEYERQLMVQDSIRINGKIRTKRVKSGFSCDCFDFAKYVIRGVTPFLGPETPAPYEI